MEGNYSLQSWKMLWCECGGNKSAPLLEDKLRHLHEGVWVQGLIYVSVVLVLYAAGFALILLHGERSFHSSSGGGRWGLHFGCPEAYGRRKKRHHRDRGKREAKERRERKQSKEIELRRLPYEPKFLTTEMEAPSSVEVKGSILSNQEKNECTEQVESKPPNPLIKVTVETSISETSPPFKDSSSNLLSFI